MTSPAERPSSGRRTIAALVLGIVAFAFQQTSIVPAIHDVQESLGASTEWSSWLVTVYLMVATVATPAMGRLGDLHGRRRVLLVGLVVFALSSVGAAVAPDIVLLILARAVQGIGGAVYPLALALAREQTERPRRSMSLLSAAFGVGTALGFVGGGALAQYVTWRAIFVVGAVLVGVAAVVTRRALAESEQRAGGDFDVLGTVLLTIAAIALLAGLTVVVSLGWTAPVTLGLLVIAAAAGVAWVRHERRAGDPLIDVHVLTLRPVAVANLATVGLGWCLFASYLLIPSFARTQGPYGLGAGSALVGLLMLPLAVGQTACAVAAGALDRVPARLIFALGSLLLAAGSGILAVTQHSHAALAVGALALGMGAGFGLQSSSAIATGSVGGDVAAVSASVNSTVRRLAGGIGGQTSTLLLASLAVRGAPRFAAYQVAYVVALALTVLGAALVLVVPPRRAEDG